LTALPGPTRRRFEQAAAALAACAPGQIDGPMLDDDE